jgi:secreted trypsin-like serine protease
MRMRMLLSVAVLPLLVACASASAETDSADLAAQDDAIVGGAATTAYSYVVGVGSDSQGAFCTGTVISKRVVITAAHCVGGINRVFFGTKAARPAAVVVVASETAHPGYNDVSMANDLAILALEADAPVQPAPLVREALTNSSAWIGPDFTFVGFGLTNGNTQTGFGTKRVVKFPIAAVGPARVGGTPGSVDSTQFYYRVAGKNTCNGDSGGPAFATRRGVLSLAGVTSFGDGPCTFDGVQQKTDQAAIQSFIQPRIDQIERGNACKNDGVCNESCNTGGQVKDPDCHVNHCIADGICARACASDPDCR